MTTTVADRSVLADGTPIELREEALATGADELAGGRRSWVEDSRVLPIVAAATMTMGLTAILLGWFGAAQSTLVQEQIPYLISGGLLGLGLATIGALLFFSHWLTVSIKEARQREHARRQDHLELMEALHALARRDREGDRNGRARSTRTERPLRGAPRSS